ncbi:MAG: DUF3962 domain-containing protein [Microcoleaceae cyanobacterium]
MHNNQLLYTKLNSKKLKQVPLALTIPDNLPPVTVEGSTIFWTKEALANFEKVQSQINTIKNLPYASLRGLIEVKLLNVFWVEANMGLSQYHINKKEQYPFVYLQSKDENQIQTDLRPILNDWIENYLVPYAKKEEVSEDIIERFRQLQEENQLLLIQPFQSQIMPWQQHDESNTAKPDKYSFPALANYLARLITENEIFPGLGSIKRIITSKGGSRVELMTDPISLDGQDLFSLVVELEIVTFPSVPQPLIKIDVCKRRWFSNIKENSIDRNSINAYILSQNYSDRVFNFKLHRRKNQQTNKWEWQPDDAFSVLQRELHLPLNISNAGQIIRGKPSNNDCKVFLTHRNGLQEKKHTINVGVPEVDKLEAFKAIAKLLEPFGIKPFEGYSEVSFTSGKGHSTQEKDRTEAASRQINKPTLLNAVLEFLETGDINNFTNSRTDEEINNLLDQHFKFRLSEKGLNLFKIKATGENKNQFKQLQELIQLNKEAIQRLYPEEKPLLIIFYEKESNNILKLLKTIIAILFADSIDIEAQLLPENTHGLKKELPGSQLKNKKRSQKRIEAWTSVAKQIAAIKRPKFCLVMAREFYPNLENNKYTHDDSVNKPSTRQALASIGKACVQFLVPPGIYQKTGDINLSDFIFPVQSSIKDLFWTHSGRIDHIPDKVSKWFGDIEETNRPKEIIAITIVRKNSGRVRGRLENSFLLIAIRINVATGLCEMCVCYEDYKTKKLVKTDWQPFNQALSDIATISPISLGDNKNTRKQHFQDFVDDVISNSVDQGNNPVVMIDSSNCVKLWNWLSDSKMNLSDINIGSKQYMQENWKGARIVRIRQDLAPGIIQDKVKKLAETSLEDTCTKEELEADEDKQITLSVPTNVFGLYKLNIKDSTNCSAYLSVGKTTLHKNKRGMSCYRPTALDKQVKIKDEDNKNIDQKNQAGLSIQTLETQPPHIDQWPTPNPLEIVVTLCQTEDKPDNIAGFIESLRYGYGHFKEWTKLPAPLFFERVVRDYISAFTLEEE